MENIITKKLVDELTEDSEFDKKIIKTFKLKKNLSPVVFTKESDKYVMIESVRNKLLEVSNAFFSYIDIDVFIYDIVLTGSLANYNWSKYSDIDLHILINMDELYEQNSTIIKQIIKDFFTYKKNIWNTIHKIKIKNYDVELYVEDINEKHVSSGVYSILNNEWIKEPKKEKYDIDEDMILKKGEEYGKLIDDLTKKNKEGIDVSDEISDIKNKLKKFRQSGLETGGEFSYENLTFKLLRRNKYIEKLYNLNKDITTKKLSLNEEKKYPDSDIIKLERAAVNHYGKTDSFIKAGFITPSGYLLDFSEGKGSRVQDHRNIGGLFYDLNLKSVNYEELNEKYWKGMRVAMDMGFIRYIPESKSMEINVMPSQEQFEVIRKLIRKYDGKITIEMNLDAYIKYDEGTPEHFIIDGIKRYFIYGVKPKSYDDIEDEYLYESK